MNPPAPVANTAPADLDGNYTVSWAYSTGVTSYQLQERLNSGSWSTVYSGSSTSTNRSGRSLGTWAYRLRHCSGSNCGPYSDIETTLVASSSAIAPEPTMIGATANSATPFSASIDYKGNSRISIPVRVLDGVNGFQPSLSLSYSSGGSPALKEDQKAEGTLGYGWRLSGLSEIRRCRVGIGGSLAYDSSDVLCLDGSALIKVSGSSYWADGAEYRTEIESKVKLVAQGSGLANRSFKAYYSDGSSALYGTTTETRLKAAGETDPYLWSIRSQTDSFNNSITYTWDAISEIGTNFIRQIDYGTSQIRFYYQERCISQTQCDADEVQNGENVPGINNRIVALNRIRTYLYGAYPFYDYRLDSSHDSNGLLKLERLQVCANYWHDSTYTCNPALDFDWQTLSISESGSSNIYDLPVVEEITNSYGDKTNFKYAVINPTDSSHAASVPAHPAFAGAIGGTGLTYSNLQRALAKEINRPNGLGGQTTTVHRYHSYPRFSSQGRGYLGFAATDVEHYDNKMQVGSTESHYDGHVRTQTQYLMTFPFFGKPARRIVDVDTNSSSSYQWSRVNKEMWSYQDKIVTGTGARAPLLKAHFSIESELQSNRSNGYSNAQKTLYDYCYASYSNGSCSGSEAEHLSGVTTTAQSGLYMSSNAALGAWGSIDASASINGVTRNTKTETTFSNVPANWVLGFTEATKTSWAGASPTYSDSVETEFARHNSTSNNAGVVHTHPNAAPYDTTTTLGYDSFGNLTSSSQTGSDMPLISSFFSSFSNNLYPQTITNAKSQSSTVSYDSRLGLPYSVTDPNGNTRNFYYDYFGRTTSQSTADGTWVSTSYSSCANNACSIVNWATPRLKVTTTTTNNGTTVAPARVDYYDSNGNLVLSEVAHYTYASNRVQYHYDANGRLLKESLPYHAMTPSTVFVEYFYDYKGRVTHVSRPDGSDVTTDIYADSGTSGYINVVVEDVGTGNEKRSRFDRLGQLFDTTDGYGSSDSVTAQYAYTTRGQLDTVNVDGIEVADIDYLSVGLKSQIDEPNSGITTYSYYSNGWQKQVTNDNNNKTRFNYDALGRTTQRIDGYLGSSPVTNTWVWDTATNGIGLLASRSNGSEFTETYSYDGESRLDTITASINVPGFNDTGPYVFGFDYNSSGQLLNTSYPNLTVTHTYWASSYPYKLKKGSTTLHSIDNYDTFGGIKNESFGNGLKTARTFDPTSGRLSTIKTGTQSDNDSIQDLFVEWRSNGSLLKRHDKRGTSSTNDDYIETFGYDELDRLKTASAYPFGRDLAFAYDDHGNIESKTSDISGDLDATNYSYPWTTSDPHRLNSVLISGISNTLSYDSVGNITRYNASSGDDTYIDYDDSERVEKITVGTSSGTSSPTARDEFWYGPDGGRYLRKATWMDGSILRTSWTLYLQGGAFEEVHPSNTGYQYRQRVMVSDAVQHQFVRANPYYAWSQVDYVHRDHLGSVVNMTSSSQTLIQSTDFDPFGTRRGDAWNRDATAAEKEAFANLEESTNGRGFTDHVMLNRTGFVHMNGRVYDGRIGRFVQPDPIVGSPSLSQNYNRYAYVLNNPLRYTDPSGYDKADCGDSGCDTQSTAGGSSAGGAGGGPVTEIVVTGRRSNPGSIARRHGGSSLGGGQIWSTDPVAMAWTETVYQDSDGNGGVIASDFEQTGAGDPIPQGGLNNSAFVGYRTADWSGFDISKAQVGEGFSLALPGTAAGERAAGYWANIAVNSDHPLAWMAHGPGAVAALWTADTALSTSITLGTAGFSSGAYFARLGYYRYVGPHSLSGSRWLLARLTSRPPYPTMAAAKDALQLPYMPIAYRAVRVPFWKPVVGPRPITINPQWGRGGGMEWYQGWRFPK